MLAPRSKGRFHALAQAQTELVCHLNQALIGGVAETLGPHCPDVALEPDRGRCCVVLAPVGGGT
jgi:predicted ArsR family transcriptional regulator